MTKEFENMMAKLNFFLRLQIMQCQDDIFVNQIMYDKEFLKKHGLESWKHDKTQMSSSCKLDLESCGKLVLEKLYRGMI